MVFTSLNEKNREKCAIFLLFWRIERTKEFAIFFVKIDPDYENFEARSSKTCGVQRVIREKKNGKVYKYARIYIYTGLEKSRSDLKKVIYEKIL